MDLTPSFYFGVPEMAGKKCPDRQRWEPGHYPAHPPAGENTENYAQAGLHKEKAAIFQRPFLFPFGLAM